MAKMALQAKGSEVESCKLEYKMSNHSPRYSRKGFLENFIISTTPLRSLRSLDLSILRSPFSLRFRVKKQRFKIIVSVRYYILYVA